MRRKDAERRLACEMRAKGLTLREIAGDLDVAVSSVSVWVRGVEVPPWRLAPTPARRRPAGALPLRKLTVANGERDLRRCGRCGEFSPSGNFSRHSRSGRQHWCKPCFRKYFESRGQAHRDQVDAARRKRIDEDRRIVNDCLRSGCVDCGTTERDVLEFDHIGPKRQTSATWSEPVSVLAGCGRRSPDARSCASVAIGCEPCTARAPVGVSIRNGSTDISPSPSLSGGTCSICGRCCRPPHARIADSPTFASWSSTTFSARPRA